MFEVLEDAVRVGCGIVTVAGVALFFLLLITASSAVLLAGMGDRYFLCVGTFTGTYVLSDLLSFGYKKLKRLF